MTSAVYAGGVEATAISNITTAVTSRFTTSVNGTKVLDAVGLAEWLRQEFEKISTGTEYTAPATAASSLNAAQAVPVLTLATNLAAQIGPTHWVGRSDWPFAGTSIAGPDLVHAAVTGIAELRRLVGEVHNYFVDLQIQLPEIIRQFYVNYGMDALVPPAVEREIETRTVIYTYVTDWDEESAPSPASVLADMDQNDTATYTAIDAPAGRYIDRIRWYRSNSNNTDADFNFAGEALIADLAFTDAKKAEELEEPCPSTTWAEPPANLQGLVGMPNGIDAGFFDNTVCFCEPYHEYAWPESYRITTEWPVVGLGVFGQTLFVGTQGSPYFISGSDSASMSSVKQDSTQACASRRSIAAVGGGVVYASPDGLCLASQNGIEVLTRNHFSRDQWQALTPSSIFGAEHEGTYYFSYTGGGGGCYALHLPSGRLTTVTATATTLYPDMLTDTIYRTTGTSIVGMFTSASAKTAVWRSKKIVLPAYAGFAWITAESDFDVPVTVRIYAEGSLWHTATLSARTPQRLPAGQYLEFEVEVESAARVTTILIAGTAQELQAL